jgi:hypothetical protein
MTDEQKQMLAACQIYCDCAETPCLALAEENQRLRAVLEAVGHLGVFMRAQDARDYAEYLQDAEAQKANRAPNPMNHPVTGWSGKWFAYANALEALEALDA